MNLIGNLHCAPDTTQRRVTPLATLAEIHLNRLIFVGSEHNPKRKQNSSSFSAGEATRATWHQFSCFLSLWRKACVYRVGHTPLQHKIQGLLEAHLPI